MPFKIRIKLIVAFMSLISVILIVTGLVGYYILSATHRALDKVEAVAEEIIVIGSLQHSLEHVLMPANDYLITGDRKYIDDFNVLSERVEEGFKKTDELLSRFEAFGLLYYDEEERKTLKDVKTAWLNIREISIKILNIPNPIGNKDGARIMEEMDYRWGEPATAMLQKWYEGDIEEYKEVIQLAEKSRRMSWIIMALAANLLLILGVGFTAFYSKLFVRPIEAIHIGADAIAAGNFKTRLDVKTGDEIEHLANGMNKMAAQLDALYSNLNGMVDGRTRELRESEERFRVVLEMANDGIVCINTTDSIYLWNKRAEEMFGYKAEEIMGKSFHGLIVPEGYKEQAFKGLESFFKTGEGKIVNKSVEVFARRKDGTEFPVEISISALKIKDEWHATGFIRDITQRKQAEEELRLRAQLLDSVSDTIFVLDFNGNFVYLNEAAWKTRGYTRDEMMGINLHVLDTPKYEKLIESRMRDLMEKGQCMFESEQRRKDGSVMPVEINAGVIELGGRKLALSIIRDITERKRVEAQLKNSEKRHRQIIQTSMDGFWVTDTKGRILDVNNAYCQLVGYACEELLNMRITDMEAKETPEETAQHIQEIMMKGHGRFETRHRRKDGQLLDIEISVVYPPDKEDGQFFIFLRDITERKRAEGELAKHVDELERYMKATVQREFRIKELRDRVEDLEKRLKG